MIRYDMIQYDTIQYDTIQYYTIQYNTRGLTYPDTFSCYQPVGSPSYSYTEALLLPYYISAHI